MGTGHRFVFTQHAVERYIKRHAPHLSQQDARAMLERAGEGATRLRERSLAGDVQWSITEPDAILVVKPENGMNICVTVLPSARGSSIPDDELELMAATPLLTPLDEVRAKAALLAAAKQAEREQQREQERQRREAERVAAEAAIATRGKTAEARRELHKLSIEMAKVRQAEKTARHIATRDHDASRARAGLKLAVRYITSMVNSDPEARRLAEELAAIEPGWLTDEFIKSKG